MKFKITKQMGILMALLVIIIILSTLLPVGLYLDGFTPRRRGREGFSSYSAYDQNELYVNKDYPVGGSLNNSDQKGCKMIQGMDGLFCSPDHNEMIDPIYGVQGSDKCTHGSGYATHNGSLCFSPDQLRLMETRGLNSTGKNATDNITVGQK